MSEQFILIRINDNKVVNNGRDFPEFFTKDLEFVSKNMDKQWNDIKDIRPNNKLTEKGFNSLKELAEIQSEFDNLLKLNKEVYNIREKRYLYEKTIQDYVEMNSINDKVNTSFYEIRFLSKISYHTLYEMLTQGEYRVYGELISDDKFANLVNKSFALLYLSDYIGKESNSLYNTKYEDYTLSKPLLSALKDVINDDDTYSMLIDNERENHIKRSLANIIDYKESISNKKILESYGITSVEVNIYKKHYNLTNMKLLKESLPNVRRKKMTKNLADVYKMVKPWFKEDINKASKLKSTVGLKELQRELNYKSLEAAAYICPLANKQRDWLKYMGETRYVDEALNKYIKKYPDTSYAELGYITGLNITELQPYLMHEGVSEDNETFASELRNAFIMVCLLEKYTNLNSISAISKSDEYAHFTNYTLNKEFDRIINGNDYYKFINKQIDKTLKKRIHKLLNSNINMTQANIAYKCQIEPLQFGLWMMKHNTTLKALRDEVRNNK